MTDEGHVPDEDALLEALKAAPARHREAVLGELIQDRGVTGPDRGLFILGVDGYFDVDNTCWCEHQDGDAPWDSEHFRLLGPLPGLLRRLTE